VKAKVEARVFAVSRSVAYTPRDQTRQRQSQLIIDTSSAYCLQSKSPAVQRADLPPPHSILLNFSPVSPASCYSFPVLLMVEC